MYILAQYMNIRVLLNVVDIDNLLTGCYIAAASIPRGNGKVLYPLDIVRGKKSRALNGF